MSDLPLELAIQSLYLPLEDLAQVAAASHGWLRRIWLAHTRLLCDRACSVIHCQHWTKERPKLFHASVGWSEPLLRRWTQWYSLCAGDPGWASPASLAAADSHGVTHSVVQSRHMVRFVGWSHKMNEPLSQRPSTQERYVLWRSTPSERFQPVLVESVWWSSISERHHVWLRTHSTEHIGILRHSSRHCQLLPLDDLTAVLCLTKTLQGEPGLPPEVHARLERPPPMVHPYKMLSGPSVVPCRRASLGAETPLPAHVAPATSASGRWKLLPEEFLKSVMSFVPEEWALGGASKDLFPRTLRAREALWADAAQRRIADRCESSPVTGRRYSAYRPAWREVSRWCEWRHMETAPPPASLAAPISPGRWLDVRDQYGFWHPAVVISAGLRSFRVRWYGWSSRMAETLKWGERSSRCAMLFSHSYSWGLPIRLHTYAILVPRCVCALCRCEVVVVRDIYRCPTKAMVHVKLQVVGGGRSTWVWQHRDRGTLMPLTDQTAQLALHRYLREEPHLGGPSHAPRSSGCRCQ